MNKADQRIAAKELYMLGWEQGKIARLVDVTEATVSNWANRTDSGPSWKEERAKKFSLEDTISGDILELIHYQIRAIKSIIKVWQDENTGSKPLPLIGKGEIDALSKMHATIKQKDLTWSHYVSACKEVEEYVATKDSAFAMHLTEFTHAFLMQKRETLL